MNGLMWVSWNGKQKVITFCCVQVRYSNVIKLCAGAFFFFSAAMFEVKKDVIRSLHFCTQTSSRVKCGLNNICSDLWYIDSWRRVLN